MIKYFVWATGLIVYIMLDFITLLRYDFIGRWTYYCEYGRWPEW